MTLFQLTEATGRRKKESRSEYIQHFPSCHASALSAHHSDIHLFAHGFCNSGCSPFILPLCFLSSSLPSSHFYICHILSHCALLQFLIFCCHATSLPCLLPPFCTLLYSFLFIFLTLPSSFFLHNFASFYSFLPPSFLSSFLHTHFLP